MKLSKIMLLKSRDKYLNQKWFYLSLFALNLGCFFSVNKTSTSLFGAWSNLALGVYVVSITIFTAINFWLFEVHERLKKYGHWRGAAVVRELQIHQELNQLREAMIWSEVGGDKYWQVLSQLADVESEI